jgi:hypothetical protein
MGKELQAGDTTPVQDLSEIDGNIRIYGAVIKYKRMNRLNNEIS